MPEGFSVNGKKSLMIHGFNAHSDASAEADFVITAPENVEPSNRIVLEINLPGRISPLYAPITILG